MKDKQGLNSFYIATKNGHGKVLRILAKHGIDIYNTDMKGNNALHISAKKDADFGILRMLVESRYELDRQNEEGATAMHVAAQKGNLRSLQVLVENGANIDILNKHSLCPLYLAVLNNHVECVRYLTRADAKAFFDDNDTLKDRSPVFLATRNQ